MYHCLLQFDDDNDEAFEDTAISIADRLGMIDFKGFGGTFSFIFERWDESESFRLEIEELAKFANKTNFYAQSFPYKGKINV